MFLFMSRGTQKYWPWTSIKAVNSITFWRWWWNLLSPPWAFFNVWTTSVFLPLSPYPQLILDFSMPFFYSPGFFPFPPQLYLQIVLILQRPAAICTSRKLFPGAVLLKLPHAAHSLRIPLRSHVRLWTLRFESSSQPHAPGTVIVLRYCSEQEKPAPAVKSWLLVESLCFAYLLCSWCSCSAECESRKASVESWCIFPSAHRTQYRRGTPCLSTGWHRYINRSKNSINRRGRFYASFSFKEMGSKWYKARKERRERGQANHAWYSNGTTQ